MTSLEKTLTLSLCAISLDKGVSATLVISG